MSNKSYAKGYRFQLRVKKYLEKLGWQVIIRPKSKFPDLHCYKKNDMFDNELFVIMEVECKTNKYLTKEEKEKAEAIKKQGISFYIAWRDNKKIKLEEL